MPGPEGNLRICQRDSCPMLGPQSTVRILNVPGLVEICVYTKKTERCGNLSKMCLFITNLPSRIAVRRQVTLEGNCMGRGKLVSVFVSDVTSTLILFGFDHSGLGCFRYYLFALMARHERLGVQLVHNLTEEKISSHLKLFLEHLWPTKFSITYLNPPCTLSFPRPNPNESPNESCNTLLF